MNQPPISDSINAEASAFSAPHSLPKARFPLVCLVVFWALGFYVSTLTKPYFVGFMYSLASTAILSLVFLGWWWFNRSLRRWEKVVGFGLLVLEAYLVSRFSHRSVTAFTLWMLGLPVLASIIVLWVLIARRWSFLPPRIGFVVLVTMGWIFFLAIRMDGADASLKAKMHLRWTPTAEEQFLAGKNSHFPAAVPSAPLPVTVVAPALDWVAFRGENRDGVITGSTIATNWSARPPVLVWKRAVGPAWSSLIVVGHQVFTQEQRADKEAVVSYDADSGEAGWVHEDSGRFEESVSGPGPRATPTYADRRLYTLGGTGWLNCLEAATGRLVWKRNIKADSGAAVPVWAFSGSPLVTGGLVIVYAGGNSGKGLLAYQTGTGELVWTAAAGASSYSSPQLTSLCGVPQCLMLHDAGLSSFALSGGQKLWETGVVMKGAPRCGQPRLIDNNKLMVAALGGLGSSLIEISSNGGHWLVTTKWDSKDLKPEFPDFVIQHSYAYGFDIGIFCCLNLADGKRVWKEGRYGRGEVMLLQDQNLLLISSETGELVLLAADPSAHHELARFQALQGKTWNHPVVRGDRVYLRNAEEMACYSASMKVSGMTAGK